MEIKAGEKCLYNSPDLLTSKVQHTLVFLKMWSDLAVWPTML